jgi:hypothetical protein
LFTDVSSSLKKKRTISYLELFLKEEVFVKSFEGTILFFKI